MAGKYKNCHLGFDSFGCMAVWILHADFFICVKADFRITLPLLTPTIFFNLVMQMINGFLAFTQSYIITQGKPMNSTLFYTVYMYQQSFEFYNTGYGAALAWVMLAIIGAITLLLFATKKFWVYEEG